MQDPTVAQFDAARRLLAREARRDESGGEHGGETAKERAEAAARVYENVLSYLGPLLGPSAARAIFARSVKLTAPRFACLGKIVLDPVERRENLGEQIVSCVDGETPDAVTETMVALFARLLALLGALIGEQLTAKVLRESRTSFRASDPKEETES